MTIDRRAFLAGAGSVLATARMGAAYARTPARIGLQLFTVRELFQRDPVATLRQVAAIGYREVEFGGGNYETMDHVLLRRTMDRLHLTAPSIHIPYETLATGFPATVRMAKTLGADTLVVPWLSPDLRTEAAFGTVVANLDRFAAQAHDAGLRLAYHNHDFEFTTRLGDMSLYDRLVQDTDPARLTLELDLYWVAYAGADPAALIERLRGRIYSFHVKDMRADKTMCAVGSGTIDFARLFALRGAAGVRHFYVENDEAPAPYLPDIAISFKTLRGLRRP